MSRGSLVVVGTGIAMAHLTLESKAQIEQADLVIYVVADPVTDTWIHDLNPKAESLQYLYEQGKPRFETYNAMIDRILDAVREGKRVCAVFYGHPGVFVYPSHEAIKRARSEGFDARMLPGISAEDCVFADLNFDPSTLGCQQFEATHFVVCKRTPDTGGYLLLWQPGVVGELTYNIEKGSLQKDRTAILRDTLLEYYPSDHVVMLYEASQYPVCEPKIDRFPLSALAEQKMSGISTLVIPPSRQVTANRENVSRLKVSLGNRREARASA